MSETLTGRPGRFARGLREVAPRTFAWLQPNGGLGEANAGLVVGDGASLVVDTLWDQELARTMLAAMSPVTAGAPIRTAVNTHADGDHWWGNAELPAGAEIIATAATQRAMKRDTGPAQLALLTAAMGAAGRLPGPAGPRARRGAASFAPFHFRGVRRRWPTRTFDGALTLDVGGREVRLEQIGPAHSHDDTIVHVPDVGVVFAADLLFVGVAPIMWVGPLENWLRGLQRLLDLDAEVYVPGHGDLAARAEVELLHGYWRWVDERSKAHHAAGRPPLEAARAMLAESAGQPWGGWDEPERVVVSLDTIFRALDGRRPVGPRSPQRLALLGQVATLAAEREAG